MPHSTQLDNERNTTSTPESEAGVLVVRRHHLLVRCSHWLNVPILLGLILSGLSIYWASPVYQHKPNPLTGNTDPLADVGTWICAQLPGLHQYSSPPDWVYNHISLGPGMLAVALRLHWLCAYLFMLNGLVFVIGSAMGGGWRSVFQQSPGANLHQIADYPAQEQLPRSHTRPQLYSRMAFDSGRARFRLKRFFEHPEPARLLPGA